MHLLPAGYCSCLTLLFLALPTHLCAARVVLTYAVYRHGARNALSKTLLLQEQDAIGGVTLLPEGQRQCFNAGAAYRQRYLEQATCSVTGTCMTVPGEDTTYGVISQGNGFHNYNTYVRSSQTDRAMLSAAASMAGIFPAQPNSNSSLGIPTGQTLVPVYTQSDVDDYLIRAYTKCNTYQQRLSQWYLSSSFQEKSAASQPLREYIKTLQPSLNVQLSNWWNVYDLWNVYRTWGVGDPMPSVNQTTFDQMVSLAYWLEVSKMNSNLTGNSLGGPLLADMLQYMSAAVSTITANSSHPYYRLLHVHAHYNVQLAVLSALKLDQYSPAVSSLAWLTNKLPATASAMIFELHQGAYSSSSNSSNSSGSPLSQGTDFYVRLVVQDGPSKAWQEVPLPCAQADDAAEIAVGRGACTLANFRSVAQAAAISTAAQWCSICNNTDAGPCKVASAQAAAQAAQAAAAAAAAQAAAAFDSMARLAQVEEDCEGDKKVLKGGVVAGVVVTFFVVLAATTSIFCCFHKRARSRWAAYHGEEPGELMSPPSLQLPSSSMGAIKHAPAVGVGLGSSV